MNRFKLGSILLLFVLVVVGCQRRSAETITSKEKAVAVNSDMAVIADAFRIIVATGGGTTGLTKGYTLHSTGVVQHWQQFPARDDSVLWLKSVDPAKIIRFKIQLEESGMLKVTHRETGNMTTSITFDHKNGSHGWSWPGVGVTNATPAELEEWYKTVDAYCKTLGTEF